MGSKGGVAIPTFNKGLVYSSKRFLADDIKATPLGEDRSGI